MNLFMVGLDHTSASVATRECLAFSAHGLAEALALLTKPTAEQPPLLQEAVILSTCNRVEVYGVACEDNAEDRLIEFLAAFHQLELERFRSALLIHRDEAVIDHLFQTTAGLRSLVLGEAQIQGQVRKAFQIAQRAQSVGPVLSRLFSRAISTGKRVRRETRLGEGAASVSQAGISLAEQRLGSLEGRSVLLVGSGKMSELAAQNLLAYGAGKLAVINRTYAHAAELAARYGAQAYHFDQLLEALAAADIVISSTSAPGTILQREQIEAALALRATDPTAPTEMLLIDLAVPRDVASDVVEVPGVHLCTIDDLNEVIASTLDQRGAAVAAAHQIVWEEYSDFSTWLRIQNTMPILSSWRQQAEELRTAEVERAMRRLGDLSPEQQYVVEALSRSLVNKLLHAPTLQTKRAAATGDGQRYAEMLRDLWCF